ncbi:MAG: 50S ribosomal protein L28 [Chloroflexota bacterium]
MSARCELCGKTSSFGNNVSHSKRRTSRRWVPNIQKSRMLIDGKLVQVQICTRCMRTLSKQTA